MNQAIIQRDDSKLSISFTQAAQEMKESALAISGIIGKVANAEDQTNAVQAQMALKEVATVVEKARKAAKEPVLEYGRTIDAAARSFVEPISEELVRVSKLVGDWVALEQMKARAEEQARNEKLLEIEREKAKALTQANSHESAEAIVEHFNRMAETSAPPIESPPRAEGQRIQEDWSVTVTDVWALARAHPGCVRIEPLVGQIKAMLNSGVKVAGVKAEKIIKADVRVKKGTVVEV